MEGGELMSFEGMTKREALERIAQLEKLTELDGATFTPEEGVQLANAGQFAAYWNALTPERRELTFVAMRDAATEAARCFIENHDGRIADYETRLYQEALDG